MEFEEACSEVSFIIDNLEPDAKAKIPDNVLDFLRKNKSNNYEITLTTEKVLKEQELKPETKAFIEIIKAKYLCPGEDSKIEELLNDVNFESKNVEELQPLPSNWQVVVYKEHKILKFFKKLWGFLRHSNANVW